MNIVLPCGLMLGRKVYRKIVGNKTERNGIERRALKMLINGQLSPSKVYILRKICSHVMIKSINSFPYFL